jgi:transcriptional regulator with XRE-family HTH domain
MIYYRSRQGVRALKSAVGKVIAALRAKRGLTQEGLAKAINSSIPTIWRWENDESEPRASDIKKLCEVLNVTEAELLNGPKANELRINIIWTKEDIDMNVLSIEPNEVNFACKPKEIILWGSFPNNLTPEELAELVKNEFVAACKGGSVRDETRRKLEEI